MHYSFPGWMFTTGDQSPCYTQRNYVLSDADKQMAGEAYPQDETEMEELISVRKENLQELVRLEALPSTQKERFERQLRFLKK